MDGFHAESFQLRRNRVLGGLSEVVAPVLRIGAAALSRGARSDPSAWRTGLILGHNHLGDALYRTCSLPALRRALPACEWHYLTSPSTAAALATNPHLAEVLPWNHGDDSWNLMRAHFRELRHRRFDAVLCTNTVRYHPDFVLAAALGIPNRAGFVHKGLSGLITHPVPIQFPSAYAAYFRSMVSSLVEMEPDWPLDPQIFPDYRAKQEAESVMAAMGFRSENPVIACVLTTRQKRGNWPVWWMVDAIREALATAGFDLALCGDASDRAVLEPIAAQLGPTARVVAGRLSLLGFAAFLGHCAALFTLDSGPRHIGNAVGLPVIFSRNLSHSRIEAGVYCDTETDITPDLEYLTDPEIEAVARAQPYHTAVKLVIDRVRFAVRRA